MSIHIDRSERRFRLNAGAMDYVFELAENDLPVNLYWGKTLSRPDDLSTAAEIQYRNHRTERQSENARQEYPAFYGEFYHECALKAEYPDGVRCTRLRFREFSVVKEKERELLTLSFSDALHPLTLRLFYRVWNDIELIDRWSEIKNGSGADIRLDNFASACWQLPAPVTDWRLTHLAGRWGKEAMVNRLPVEAGRFVMESRTGLSGPYAVPFFALDDGSAGELSGEVFFGALQWSGNWKLTVERTPYDDVAVTGGINEFDSRITLAPGECFATPVFSGGWSSEGHSGMSRVLHRYQLRHLLPPAVAAKPMPLIFNSWGCINIHVNEANIRRAETLASRVGAELFVIDDGWQHALGDWYADPVKFPGGLAPVIEEARRLGMEFGLWVEPESFELRSDLYRQHPEWAMFYPGVKPFERYRADVDRTSVMLNFARNDVADYLYAALFKLVKETGIRYLKLDMNCFFSSPGWGEIPAAEQGRIWIDYVHNLHRVFGRLSADFPELLMENCASGAGRADLAMTRFFGRMNRSDNQDALDMLTLHTGFTQVNLPRMAGGACHISDSMYHVNHRKTPLRFQAFCGMLGSLAIGKDLTICSDAELAEIRSYTDFYKKIRHVTHFGDFYRLASAREKSYAVFEYVLPDRSEAVVFVLGASQQFGDSLPFFRIPGLDAKKCYELTIHGGENEEKRIISGQGAAAVGVRLELVGDFDARIFHFRECNA